MPSGPDGMKMPGEEGKVVRILAPELKKLKIPYKTYARVKGCENLIASVGRHYTRARGAVSEVCTVELWSFARPEQAEKARTEVEQPSWWGRTAGAELVLAHGVRLERGHGSRKELSPDCSALAEAAHARALATLRAGGESP